VDRIVQGLQVFGFKGEIPRNPHSFSVRNAVASSPGASERISIAGGIEIALGEWADDPGRGGGIAFLCEIERLLSFLIFNIPIDGLLD
jgi:hypothetical protein